MTFDNKKQSPYFNDFLPIPKQIFPLIILRSGKVTEYKMDREKQRKCFLTD